MRLATGKQFASSRPGGISGFIMDSDKVQDSMCYLTHNNMVLSDEFCGLLNVCECEFGKQRIQL